jgi:hypothetical protein
MKSVIVWHYRKYLLALQYAWWLMFKEKPKYQEGSRVVITFKSALYGTVEVLCRIREVSYRYYDLTYDVIVLEDKEWISFGTRTFVYPQNILRKQQLYY